MEEGDIIKEISRNALLETEKPPPGEDRQSTKKGHTAKRSSTSNKEGASMSEFSEEEPAEAAGRVNGSDEEFGQGSGDEEESLKAMSRRGVDPSNMELYSHFKDMDRRSGNMYVLCRYCNAEYRRAFEKYQNGPRSMPPPEGPRAFRKRPGNCKKHLQKCSAYKRYIGDHPHAAGLKLDDDDDDDIVDEDDDDIYKGARGGISRHTKKAPSLRRQSRLSRAYSPYRSSPAKAIGRASVDSSSNNIDALVKVMTMSQLQRQEELARKEEEEKKRKEAEAAEKERLKRERPPPWAQQMMQQNQMMIMMMMNFMMTTTGTGRGGTSGQTPSFPSSMDSFFNPSAAGNPFNPMNSGNAFNPTGMNSEMPPFMKMFQQMGSAFQQNASTAQNTSETNNVAQPKDDKQEEAADEED